MRKPRHREGKSFAQGHRGRGELRFQFRQSAPEPPAGPGLMSDKATIPSPSPAPVLSPAWGTCYMAMRPRGQGQRRPSPLSPYSPGFSRPVFVVPPSLGHWLSTEDRASQKIPSPQAAPLRRRSLSVTLHVSTAVTAGTQGEIRGGFLEAVTPAEQAWRGLMGREAPEGNGDSKLPP